jgi:hypothetical protein
VDVPYQGAEAYSVKLKFRTVDTGLHVVGCCALTNNEDGDDDNINDNRIKPAVSANVTLFNIIIVNV